RRDPARLARPGRLDPAPEHRRRQPEEDDEGREDESDFGLRPVARGRRRDAEEARERQLEDAVGVGLPDRQVDRERGRRHQPAIESRPGDDALAIEQTGHRRLPGAAPPYFRPVNSAMPMATPSKFSFWPVVFFLEPSRSKKNWTVTAAELPTKHFT